MNTSNNLNRDELFEPSLEEPKWQSHPWAMRNLGQDVESTYKSPSSSTGSLATLVNIAGISENEMSPSEDYQRDSNWEGQLFSNNGSSSSLPSYNPPHPRRRTLSSTSKSQGRFSMHELGSADLISGMNSKRYLSPSRHSVALDKGFEGMTKGNSYENREWCLDRERIGNAGKGFGCLIDDDGEKESIAELIANVRDEDAFKLAQITQKHANQKSRSPVPGVKNEKINDQNVSSPRDHGTRPSEVTLSKSKICKKYFEDKYREIFKIIDNHGVYSPSRLAREQQAIANRDGGEDVGFASNDEDLSVKRDEKSLPGRRKKEYPWNLSHIETRKSDNIDLRVGRDAIDSDVMGTVSHVDIGNRESSKNLRSRRRLSQIFIPPSPREKDKLESPAGPGRNIKHFRSSSLDDITMQTHDNSNKSRGWSLHLFKRKDKKHQKRFLKGSHQKSNVHNENKRFGTAGEFSDDMPLSSNSRKHLTDSSSNEQTPRSSAEFTRSSSDKESREVFNKKVKPDEGSSKVRDDKLSGECNTHDRRDSLVVSAGLSDSSFESAKDITIGNPKIRIERDPGEHHGHSNMHRSLSDDNRTTEISTEYEGDSEGDNEPELFGETVLVKLDVLPGDLVRMVTLLQEQGTVPLNDDNSRYVELDVGLNNVFKFKKLVGHEADLVDLHVSLVNKQKSIDTQEMEELMARYDECIEETTEFLEKNKEMLLERREIIRENDHRFFDNLDVPFVQSPVSNEGVARIHDTMSLVDFANYTDTMYELKRRIDAGMEALNGTMVGMESTVESLENQHSNIKEDAKVMLDQIQELTLEVNNDYFRQLKALEDDIHLLIAEQRKSSISDVFYLMMSYVLAGIMFMFCLIVAAFKITKRILLLPRATWKTFSRS